MEGSFITPTFAQVVTSDTIIVGVGRVRESEKVLL